MYIDLNLIYLVLTLLGCAALVYIIITLNNFNKLIRNANDILKENKNSINDSVSKFPEVVSSLKEVGTDMKDITEAITDVTAEFIVTKENIKSNFEVATDILTILRSVFKK